MSFIIHDTFNINKLISPNINTIDIMLGFYNTVLTDKYIIVRNKNNLLQPNPSFFITLIESNGQAISYFISNKSNTNINMKTTVGNTFINDELTQITIPDGISVNYVTTGNGVWVNMT